jgi:chemotaxis methyl-accepting protein methylase
MFAGLSEYVFHSKLGIVDTEVVDYVSSLLTRFIRLDGLQKVRRTDGSLATEVFSMVQEAEKRVGDAKREIHRHIGDFTLFWSGVYPEALREMRSAASVDHFVNYCAQGKRAYRIASTLDTSRPVADSSLLHRMSEQFEMCAYGLREVRREWEARDEEGSDGPLLI